MSFHPRMYAVTSGIAVPGPPQSIVFDDMTLDHWEVEIAQAARGKYVSIHPRLSIFFDGAKIALTRDKAQKGVSCSLCYVPAGMQLWGRLETTGKVRHLDLHIKRATLAHLLAEGTCITQPVFARASTEVLAVAQDMAHACDPAGNTFDVTHEGIKRLVQLVFESSNQLPDAAHDPIAEVRAHIMANLDKTLHLKHLAARAGMSCTQFKRRFRSDTGSPAHQWIVRQRVGLAQTLICEGVSLVEIASRAGFSDQAHLSRVFKAATGFPPGRWNTARNSDGHGPNIQY